MNLGRINLGKKTSLGIDICQDRISVALLGRAGGEIELLKTASVAVPDGAMTDGNITNPASVAGAIKQLLSKNKIRRQSAALSLAAKPVLTQIIDLPAEIPDNLGQFISAEIRHSSVLAGKEPYYGSCSLTGGGANGSKRIFVAATDNEKISTLLKTMNLAGVEPKSIELDVTATTRLLYANRISDKYEYNLLFALVHGSVMTMCVFRKGEFDFVRYIDIGTDVDDSAKCIARCEEEFSAVIQFYDIEVEAGANAKWEFVIALDTIAIDANDMEFSMQKKFGIEAHVCSSETIYTDTTLKKNAVADRTSLTAVGLAMKSLDVPGSQVKIDLLPPEIKEKKIAKQLVLVTANIAAVILLVMLVSAGIVRVRLNHIQGPSLQLQQNDPAENMESLVAQKKSADTRIEELSLKKVNIDELFKGNNIIDWGRVLDDIRHKTPADLYLTRLSCTKGLSLAIEGQSLSYSSAHLFAETLSQSEFFKAATVTGTNKNRRDEGLITYSINCELIDNRELTADVDG
ncbi:MAG: pilus assembly protein PilM [Planctomycetota bacterium]|jgi:Tfp pilus assembly protein PilN